MTIATPDISMPSSIVPMTECVMLFIPMASARQPPSASTPSAPPK